MFSENPALELAQQFPDNNWLNHQFVQPLFVSRMPTRKMTGQGHMETVKSAKRLSEKVSILRTPLTQLKLKDLDTMVNREREKALYQALQERLIQFNDDSAKAFAEPFYKKGGQMVKAIRIEKVQNTGVLLHNGTGVADNASIVRTDVFIKKGKYFLVPIYTWQVAEGILPNKAIIAHKSESEWEEMDQNAEFQFSLYPNDLVKLATKKEQFFGYYVSVSRSTASITIREHDNEQQKGKKGLHESLGVKTALSLEKYQVDELGKNIRRCKKSQRQPVR